MNIDDVQNNVDQCAEHCHEVEAEECYNNTFVYAHYMW